MKWLRLAPLMLVFVPTIAYAKDYGQRGNLFEIAETDLLSVIEDKLQKLSKSGEIDAMNQKLKARTIAKVERPNSLGLSNAEQDRTWFFDPTITVSKDITDTKGNIIAARGSTVNPLHFLPVKDELVFIDGDDHSQIEWALARLKKGPGKIVLVKGAPLELMRKRKVRFYFDQGGALVKKFGINAVPATVKQEGLKMRLREHEAAKLGVKPND